MPKRKLAKCEPEDGGGDAQPNSKRTKKDDSWKLDWAIVYPCGDIALSQCTVLSFFGWLVGKAELSSLKPTPKSPGLHKVPNRRNNVLNVCQRLQEEGVVGVFYVVCCKSWSASAAQKKWMMEAQSLFPELVLQNVWVDNVRTRFAHSAMESDHPFSKLRKAIRGIHDVMGSQLEVRASGRLLRSPKGRHVVFGEEDEEREALGDEGRDGEVKEEPLVDPDEDGPGPSRLKVDLEQEPVWPHNEWAPSVKLEEGAEAPPPAPEVKEEPEDEVPWEPLNLDGGTCEVKQEKE